MKKAPLKKTVEEDFVKAACGKFEALRWTATCSDAMASRNRPEIMPFAGNRGVEPICRLAGVRRAGFYRFLELRHLGEEEMEVNHAVMQIVLERRRRYGHRRATVELYQRVTVDSDPQVVLMPFKVREWSTCDCGWVVVKCEQWLIANDCIMSSVSKHQMRPQRMD